MANAILNTQDEDKNRTADEPIEQVTDTDVTKQEIELLDEQGIDDPDDADLKNAELDSDDFDGTPLNEGASARFNSGSDLDVPGAELDDESEEIGEEDEENNVYSEGDNQ